LEFPNEVNELSDEVNYELFSVIIHIGSAGGGHYHAYIRDVENKSNWQDLMKSYIKEKEEKKIKEKEEKLKKLQEKEKLNKEKE